MTEYIGWSNYVEEQAIREMVGYSGPNFEYKRVEQQQQRVKDLEQFREYHSDSWRDQRITNLEKTIKDLERIDRDNHNNNWKNIENVFYRLNDLEESSKPAIEKSLYESIKTRLGLIEEWKRNTLLPALLNYDKMSSRLRDLEEHDKLKDDNLHSLYWQIKHLEEWKRQHRDQFQDLEQVVKIVERVDKLEEWHKPHNIYHIDKKVWEDIKGNVGIIDRFGVDSQLWEALKHLKYAIKQADPSWCKDD